MNRAFKKYFLLLCILLINGFNNGYAHSNPSYVASENSKCGLVENEPTKLFTNSIELGFSKPLIAEAGDIEDEEEESEEVLLPANKNLIYGKAITVGYFAQMLEHFSNEIENESPYFKPNTFNASCKRHIRFQVFRI
jgi:hypothetical protein